MNFSLPLALASILGPCLLAFTAGYLSQSYQPYLPIEINEALKDLKRNLPSVVSDSFHSSPTKSDSLQLVQWNQYVDESVNSKPMEVPLTGQPEQVFVELQNVDSEFLDSEKDPETGFVTFVKRLNIGAFTYECHRRSSGKGICCMGYAGKDTFSVYTWPDSGSLSLNVRSHVREPWSLVIPLASEIFAFPMSSHEVNVKEPLLIWSLRQKDTSELTWMAYKPATPATAFDTNSIGSYEISSDFDGVNVKPVVTPQQEVTNDQRQKNYDTIYSETLVHPIMFTHDDPRRVAIIGNGTGAALREVLKHRTLEKVVLVGADADFIQRTRQLSHQHSDCGNLKGFVPNCYDDARVELIPEAPLEWLLSKEGDDRDAALKDKFDVIIFEKSDILWSSHGKREKIFANLSEMLSTDGVLVIPHGALEKSAELSILETLSTVRFKAIHRYDEFVQTKLLSFIVCFRRQESRTLWFANAAELHVKILSRLVGTVSQKSPIVHWFDEATLMNYQYPSRMVEDSFCSQPDEPYMCDEGHGFDPEIPNAPISSFAVGVSQIPGAGRGVFFQTDVAKDTYIAADESVYDMLVYPSTTILINNLIDFLDASEFLRYSSIFYTYLYGYGFAFEYFGKPGYLVDTGILTFINHGCNGTEVMGEGEPLTFTEMTVDIERMPPVLENYGTETHVYNPYIDRNSMRVMTAGDKTLFDIKKGTELVDNYLRYLHEDNWKEGVLDYRAQCIASGKGIVVGYEERKSSSPNEEFHFHPPPAHEL